MQLTTIKLGGFLGKKYGKTFKFPARNPKEAVAMLGANFKGFEADFIKYKYKVLVNKEQIGEEDIDMPVRGKCIRFIPVLAGSGNGARIVAGVILIALSYVSGAVAAAGGYQMGASLILGGVIGYMFGTPDSSDSSSNDSNKTSYLFGGTINTTGQGNPVPILYGRRVVGSQVISAGISTEAL